MLAETLNAFDLTIQDAQMILIGVVGFWVYYKLSSAVLFKPLLQLVEERERATVGAKLGAQSQMEQAERLERDYALQVSEAHRGAVSERLARLSAAAKEASAVIAGAESDAKNQISAARAEIAQQEGALRARLQETVGSLAEELANKILSGDRGQQSTTAR